MHTNLQNTPSGGPLTAADLEPYQQCHMRRPYIAHGLDMQGRHPEAAHAATDIGSDDDDLGCATGIVRALMWCLGLYAVGIAFWLALT